MPFTITIIVIPLPSLLHFISSRLVSFLLFICLLFSSLVFLLFSSLFFKSFLLYLFTFLLSILDWNNG